MGHPGHHIGDRMKTIDSAIRYMIELEALLSERDDWLSAFTTYTIKRDVIRRYGEPTEDLRQAIDELDDKVQWAMSLLEGTETEIKKKTKLSAIEEARKHLIFIKSMLNTYAEKLGVEFATQQNVKDKTSDELLLEIEEMVHG